MNVQKDPKFLSKEENNAKAIDSDNGILNSDACEKTDERMSLINPFGTIDSRNLQTIFMGRL